MAILVSVFILFTHQISMVNSSELCGFIGVDRNGFNYDGGNELFPAPLFLPFPRVYVKKDGSVESLPRSSVEGTIPFLSINGVAYRNLSLRLSLKPYPPDFLIPYFPTYWESWGERMPYVGEWQLSFDEEQEIGWASQEISGAITPSCLSDVADELLADADFNGSPSAFWNYNLIR